MPRWERRRRASTEVCYASYYDFTDQVPEEYRGPNGTVALQDRADPPGSAQPSPDRQPVRRHTPDRTTRCWGDVQVPRRGEGRPGLRPDRYRLLRHRQRLRERRAARASPASARTNLPRRLRSRRQRQRLHRHAGSGDHHQPTPPASTTRLPLKGMIIWNSHAFNTTDDGRQARRRGSTSTSRAPEEQQFPLSSIFVADHRSST